MRRSSAAAVAAIVTFAASSVCSSAVAATGRAGPVAKRAHERLAPGESRDTLDVKFAEGSDVRLRGGRLVSRTSGRIAALDDVLARFPHIRISRRFRSQSETEITESDREARAKSGRPLADLNLFFRLEVPAGTDIVALTDALNALGVIEVATPAAKPAPLPATQSFVAGQGYRNPATSGGIDADYAQTLDGGKGENVSIVDVEYSWNRGHEDLSKVRANDTPIPNGTACDPQLPKAGEAPTDHGTAVLGEIAGDANGFGVTGLAPGAKIRTVNVSSLNAAGACAPDVANAFGAAAGAARPGDVVLIEQQMYGPNSTDRTSGSHELGMVPVEWDYATFIAIQKATGLGVIVVEAAGNGSQNLDDPVYKDATGRNWFSYDSGAIIVGAGNAPACTAWGAIAARGRLPFSNHGSRLNVQGWGSCVTTAGYGLLQGAPGTDSAYTDRFGGTSSASPIVASAAAVLSSVAKQRGTTLKPAQVRSMLAATGQGQPSGDSGRIGPLPDLRAAIGALGPKLSDSGHEISGTSLGTTTVPVRQTWSGSGATRYEVWLRKKSSTDDKWGDFVKQTLPAPGSPTAVFDLERDFDYQFAGRAMDADGVWGDYVYGAAFKLGEYQEDYPASYLAFTGSWVRSAWGQASDGYMSTAAQTGASATFTFTGSNVAWIATKAANRGVARIYVDGVAKKDVDLYSASTSARAIAYSVSWAEVGAHTIKVQVLGTAGRPAVDVDAFVRLR